MEEEAAGIPFDPRIDEVLGFPEDMPEEVRIPFRLVYMKGYIESYQEAQSIRKERERFRSITISNFGMIWISGFFLGTIAHKLIGHQNFLLAFGYGWAGVLGIKIGWHFYKIRKERR